MREQYIEGIPYISKEQFYKMAHIRKSTALKLIRTGTVPAIDTGRTTNRYLIRLSDVEFYLRDRIVHPDRYSFGKKSCIQTYPCNGNVKKCAVGKHPKSEKHGNTAQFSEVERSGTQENCGGIGSGCRLRLRPLPVLRRRQSQRVARIDPNAVVVDKNIAENDRFDLFSR